MSNTGISQYQLSSDFSCDAASLVSQELAVVAHHATPLAHCWHDERLLPALLPFLPRPLVLSFPLLETRSLELHVLVPHGYRANSPIVHLVPLAPTLVCPNSMLMTLSELVWFVTSPPVCGRNPLSRMAHLRHAFADMVFRRLAGVDHLRFASRCSGLVLVSGPEAAAPPLPRGTCVDQCGD